MIRIAANRCKWVGIFPCCPKSLMPTVSSAWTRQWFCMIFIDPMDKHFPRVYGRVISVWHAKLPYGELRQCTGSLRTKLKIYRGSQQICSWVMPLINVSQNDPLRRQKYTNKTGKSLRHTIHTRQEQAWICKMCWLIKGYIKHENIWHDTWIPSLRWKIMHLLDSGQICVYKCCWEYKWFSSGTWKSLKRLTECFPQSKVNI